MNIAKKVTGICVIASLGLLLLAVAGCRCAISSSATAEPEFLKLSG